MLVSVVNLLGTEHHIDDDAESYCVIPMTRRCKFL
jgi:hypothetical protein